MNRIRIDLVGLAEKFLGRWVALDPDDNYAVLAAGDSAKAVLDDAERKGVDSPVVVWVTNDYGSITP
jgi:hypothetical protein